MADNPTTRAEAKRGRIVPRSDFRKYIYRVIAATGPLVIFYGLASAEEVALWLGLGATILGTPSAILADANV